MNPHIRQITIQAPPHNFLLIFLHFFMSLENKGFEGAGSAVLQYQDLNV